MRELRVYYCKKCGFYGFYQLPSYAVCPKCDFYMQLLDIPFKDFSNLSCEERDQLLSDRIINSNSYVSRLMASHRKANYRELIAHLSQKIEDLSKENEKLQETVEWMHQLIWDMIKENHS